MLEHAIASSVDPLEAAVVLESAGVNDRVARDLFGVADVVALARTRDGARRAGPAGHRAGRRSAAEPADAGAPRRATRWFHLRGVLYAVPALVTLDAAAGGRPGRVRTRARWPRR